MKQAIRILILAETRMVEGSPLDNLLVSLREARLSYDPVVNHVRDLTPSEAVNMMLGVKDITAIVLFRTMEGTDSRSYFEDTAKKLKPRTNLPIYLIDIQIEGMDSVEADQLSSTLDQLFG